MCGIVGYVGKGEAVEFLLEGLRRLEYRGYDSAGIVTLPEQGKLSVTKTVGRIESLSNKLAEKPMAGNIGIGHTRWATHGPPTEENAHPHFGGDNVLSIVHNGVIGHYLQLKDVFVSGLHRSVCYRALQVLDNDAELFSTHQVTNEGR